MEEYQVISNMIGKGVKLRDAMTAALGLHDDKTFPAQMVDREKELLNNNKSNLNRSRSEFELKSWKPFHLHLHFGIGDVKGVAYRPQNGKSLLRNLFIVVRIQNQQPIYTSVKWSTNSPSFQFSKSIPMLMTPELMQTLKSNFIVVEVWDKQTPTYDELLGIVKLSLHPFFLAFREQTSDSPFLNSALPVISNNDYCPIVNPFHSVRSGFLKILLAMGSENQIFTLVEVIHAATTIQKIFRGYCVRKQYQAFQIHPNNQFQTLNTSLNSSQSSVNIKMGERASPIQQISPKFEEIEFTNKKLRITVFIEAAMRLQVPIENKGNEIPNVYVTYNCDLGMEIGKSDFSTLTVQNSFSPIWNHKDILLLEIPKPELESNTLQEVPLFVNFKVYHQKETQRNSKSDILIGTAKVELTNLLSGGMKEISGWYHVIDYKKQKKGQLKVTISPQDTILPRFVRTSPLNISLQEISEKLSDVSFERLAELRIVRESLLNSRSLEVSFIDDEEFKPTNSNSIQTKENAFKSIQDQLDKELEKESDDDLKFHLQKSMHDLDAIHKNLRVKLYGEEIEKEKLVDSFTQFEDLDVSQTINEEVSKIQENEELKIAEQEKLAELVDDDTIEPIVQRVIEQNTEIHSQNKRDETSVSYNVSSLDTEERANLDTSREELMATYNQLSEQLKSPTSSGVFVTAPKDSLDVFTSDSIKKYEAEWKASLRARTNIEFTEKEMQRIRKIMNDKV